MNCFLDSIFLFLWLWGQYHFRWIFLLNLVSNKVFENEPYVFVVAIPHARPVSFHAHFGIIGVSGYFLTCPFGKGTDAGKGQPSTETALHLIRKSTEMKIELAVGLASCLNTNPALLFRKAINQFGFVIGIPVHLCSPAMILHHFRCFFLRQSSCRVRKTDLPVPRLKLPRTETDHQFGRDSEHCRPP